MDGLEIPSILESLTWTKEGASFPGQLVPPRPNRLEMSQLATPLGKFIHHQGVVLQKGPFGSKWLRAGCRQDVPWATMWRTLQKYVEALQADAQSKRQGSKGAIYVAVSLISMQSVDFEWLENKGFRFHHYRAPGHGATPGEDGADSDSQGNAELVYYAWPAGGHDMVPVYATSIEGVTGLVFSRDESKLLMVWERQAWGTPGGAVDAGESKIDALERECMEEVEVKLDRNWSGTRFLGGWQQQCARDKGGVADRPVVAVRLSCEPVQTAQEERLARPPRQAPGQW